MFGVDSGGDIRYVTVPGKRFVYYHTEVLIKESLLLQKRITVNVRTSLAVLTALCKAITIVTVFFVLQIRPLLGNHWLMLLRSSLIMHSPGLANVFETKMNLGMFCKQRNIRIVTCFRYVVYMNIKQSWNKDGTPNGPNGRCRSSEPESLHTTNGDLPKRQLLTH